MPLLAVLATMLAGLAPAQTSLNSGTPISENARSAGFYSYMVDVSDWHGRLTLSYLTKSTSTADVYIRFGQPATTSAYDLVYRNVPRVTTTLSNFSTPALKSGRYYMLVYARKAQQFSVTGLRRHEPSSQPGMGSVPFTGGTTFRVWAPFANSVQIAGSFNAWSTSIDLKPEGNGNWSLDYRNAFPGNEYKYVVRNGTQTLWRIDPRAKRVTNSTGNSVIVDPSFAWTSNGYGTPNWNEMVIYEMHIGTFNDSPGGAPGTLDSAISRLDYLRDMGVNAIQLMPVFEFPGDFSWGYNPSHPFAVESAYGGPAALKRFVDACHSRGIAVLMDFVHNHWGPNDLSMWRFDGWFQNDRGGIYFYNDARANTPWGNTRPDFGRGEVRQYIRDNVLMFLEEYRIDGLRWDSTLYTRTTEWGDNPDGWSLMQYINNEIRATQPWKLTIAEDLQNNPWLTKTTGEGGAGFGSQWTPNFVHPIRDVIIPPSDSGRDMNRVVSSLTDRYNGDAFQRVVYTESHDEVANGKQRVPESIWQGNAGSYYSRKRSTLGAALVMTAPGIPMIFQGQEILEDGWFTDTDPVDWNKLSVYPGINLMYKDLIRLRRNLGNTTRGLMGQHINAFHANNTDKVVAFHRWQSGGTGDDVVVVANFSNTTRLNYWVGLPRAGMWRVRFNSDWSGYSPDFANTFSPDFEAQTGGLHGLGYRGFVNLGPYSAVILSQ